MGLYNPANKNNERFGDGDTHLSCPAAGGPGKFNESGQSLGNSESWKASLSDADGDGDLDAFVADGGGPANKV